MARYEHEFQGISAEPMDSRGMDPNYRGGRYRGMRMRGGPDQAAYGWYRWRHADELEDAGGFRGASGPFRRLAAGYDRDHQGLRMYDWELRQGGGVHDVRYDREFMRDFNADSSLFRDEGRREGRYGRDYRERGGHPVARPDTNRFDYANRGLSGSGYSESWAPRPGRGSR